MKLKYLNKEIRCNTMKHYTFIFILLFSITLSSAIINDIGTRSQDDCIDLIQTCADCTYVNFSSYTMPNGTRSVQEWAGIKSGTTFTYNSCNITGELGTWLIDGHGDLGGTDTIFSYTYEVTTTGNPTPEGMPMFQAGLLFIIFGAACFFLYISSQMGEVGFKIFFLILSFVFLTSTLLSGYMISSDGNVASATNSTTLSLVIVLGSVLVILFIYILIRQTVNALDLYNIKRGRAWNVGAGSQVAGFNTKRAY